jgi:hypothetical protein
MDSALGLSKLVLLLGEEDESDGASCFAFAFGGVLGLFPPAPPKKEANGFSREEAMGGILAKLAVLPDLDLVPVEEDGGGGREGKGKVPVLSSMLKLG